MNLTEREIKYLKNRQKYRDRDTAPTIFAVLRGGPLWVWIYYAACIVISVALIVFQQWACFGWLILGFVSGILYLFFTSLRRSLKLWRVTREVTDWKRIEELIRENENHVA